MNFKVVSLFLLIAMAQIFVTHQKPIRPDDDDDDNEDEYHDNEDKKSIKDNADQIVGAASDLEPPVAEKPANTDETGVNEKSEAEPEPVVNEGESSVEKSNDDDSLYIEKAQKLLEGNNEVAAEKTNSDDEPSLPKTAEVKSAPVEENKEIEATNKDEDASSNSKPEVDYNEDSDKVNLKLEPSEPKDEEVKDIKEDIKDEVAELQKPAEVRQEVKEPEIDIDEPAKKVEEPQEEVKEEFLKKPEEIRSGEVKKEEASVDKQKVVVNVAPDNGKVEEPSPVKQSETGENKQPPTPGRVNTFFIIIPGIVLAFVILIVIAFVIFQRTRSHPDDVPVTLPTTTDRKPIYQPVPQIGRAHV